MQYCFCNDNKASFYCVHKAQITIPQNTTTYTYIYHIITVIITQLYNIIIFIILLLYYTIFICNCNTSILIHKSNRYIYIAMTNEDSIIISVYIICLHLYFSHYLFTNNWQYYVHEPASLILPSYTMVHG